MEKSHLIYEATDANFDLTNDGKATLFTFTTVQEKNVAVAIPREALLALRSQIDVALSHHTPEADFPSASAKKDDR